MSRLRWMLDSTELRRYLILYGSGVSDIYFDQDNESQEVTFLYALTQHLQNKGFLRVFHISPSEPLHVLDQISEELSPGLFWKGRSEILKTGIVSSIQTGPLGEVQTERQRTENVSGLGDNHGLRIIDHYLHEKTSFHSALIINQAESFLSYFSNRRLLSGLFAEWLHLARQNSNIIVLVFNSESIQDLKKAIENIQISEIRQILYESDSDFTRTRQIEGPDKDELVALLSLIQTQDRLAIEESEFDKIVNWLERENTLNRIWADRLLSITSLSIGTLKENHWIASVLDDPRTIEEKLDSFIGLDQVKTKIREIKNWIEFETTNNGKQQDHNLHMVFLGNPGTGKTSIARIMGEMFHDYGVLTKGHLVALNGLDLVAEFVGGSTQKTNQAIQKAIGGILFIDEAYALVEKERGGFGMEVIDTLVPVLENRRGDLVVILAGYPDKMRIFLKSNPGLDRRFPEENRVIFDDFNQSELLQILLADLNNRGLVISEESRSYLEIIVEGLLSENNENFGNAGEMRNLAEGIERLCKGRNVGLTESDLTIHSEDIPERYAFYLSNSLPSPEIVLKELDQLIGLAAVKKHFTAQIQLIQYEQLRRSLLNDLRPTFSLENFVFVGNPGTGKTTVARLVGKLYHSIGLLRKGHSVEVSAVDLVAGYVGQTSIKTKEIFEQALDGVLFIDEAYSLLGNQHHQNSFAVDATNTLVKLIEDYRSRIVVILAGYPKPMADLLSSNPGLRSRFSTTITFDDFSNKELSEILHNLVSQEKYTINPETLSTAVFLLETARLVDPSSFGNAREVRNLFQLMKRNLAVRVLKQKNNRRLGNTLPANWNQFSNEDLDGYVHNRPIDSSVDPIAFDEGRFFLPKSPPPQ
jgi:SpoVK/Ycf46/Vps4 family AAA+-type ATPase